MQILDTEEAPGYHIGTVHIVPSNVSTDLLPFLVGQNAECFLNICPLWPDP